MQKRERGDCHGKLEQASGNALEVEAPCKPKGGSHGEQVRRCRGSRKEVDNMQDLINIAI